VVITVGEKALKGKKKMQTAPNLQRKKIPSWLPYYAMDLPF
jgi:hypothetical protein